MLQAGQEMDLLIPSQGPFHKFGRRGRMAAVGPFHAAAHIRHRSQVQVEAQGFQPGPGFRRPGFRLCRVPGAADGFLGRRGGQLVLHPGHLSPFLIHPDQQRFRPGQVLETAVQGLHLVWILHVPVKENHPAVVVLLQLLLESGGRFRALHAHQHQLAGFFLRGHGGDLFPDGIPLGRLPRPVLPGKPGPQHHPHKSHQKDAKNAKPEFFHILPFLFQLRLPAG